MATSFRFDFQLLWSNDTMCFASKKNWMENRIAWKMYRVYRTFNIYTGIWYRVWNGPLAIHQLTFSSIEYNRGRNHLKEDVLDLNLTLILEIMHWSVNKLKRCLINLHLSLNDLLRRSVDLMRSAHTNHLYLATNHWNRVTYILKKGVFISEESNQLLLDVVTWTAIIWMTDRLPANGYIVHKSVPCAKMRAFIVYHIKISNKLTPSINYFYDVLFWLSKQ